MSLTLKAASNCNFCLFSDGEGGCDILDTPDAPSDAIEAATEWVCATGELWNGVMPPVALKTPCPEFEPNILTT